MEYSFTDSKGHCSVLMLRCTSDPLAGTTSVGSQYLSTVTIHGRDFQEYAVQKSINFVPVDEVRRSAKTHPNGPFTYREIGRS